MLDDFESVDGWTAHPSEGVELRISRDSGFAGGAMRLDFDFRGGTGYAIARKSVPIDLPANWEFAWRMRADAPVNDLEFKLIDPSGENVWWMNRRRFEYPREWQRIRTRKRQVEFAWGPKGGGEMDSVAQIEIVVTAATGGKGTVWIDDLTFREREPDAPYTLTPQVQGSASFREQPPALAIDGDTTTVWNAGEQAWLSIDFLREREMGGLVIHWDRAYASRYRVETSADGVSWETAYEVVNGNGGRDPIYLPDTEMRHLRLAVQQGSAGGVGIREVDVKPAEWSQTPNAFFANLAKEAPRGAYPRYLTGEQSYWTVVGVSGDTRESTINTDGMVETGIGMPSIEPFLYADGRLLTWADVRAAQSLEKGYLPIPSVEWDAQPLRLTVTAFPVGQREASTVYVRYRVENRGAAAEDATLYLAARPFQVNPSWQFLNVQGGVARIREIALRGRELAVNGSTVLRTITPADTFGAAPFDAGDVVEYLRTGRLPPLPAVTDPRGFASGAVSYRLALRAGETKDVVVAIPLHPASEPVMHARNEAPAQEAERLLRASVEGWERELNRFSLRLPAAMHGEEIANTIRSQLAYILINRDGPSIQPGSRSYDRSWIRDGSLTGAALLRLGHADEVRTFAEWYAPHQRRNGYVPCCVSLRGADPVPEHDSHGQLIYLIAEHHRLTGDTDFLRRMWPHVERAVAFIDTLRHERMTPEYRTPERRAYFGLVPQSISHEGYSAKPMHSYWDDFFVLKGLDDAVYVARTLGRTADGARFAAIRDGFRTDLRASIDAAMAMHGIDFIPGSVELGDFDATSTTVGVNPMGGLGWLPQRALENTFERYYRQSIRARLDGAEWDGYTPYEWRTVGTFVRLGWKSRAHEAIGLFFGHQRPRAWNHWAEVVFRDETSPRFIGDMPHTWVGSDFIRSILDLFAYERTADDALVIGAGVPEAWVREGDGLEMTGLRTYYGTLNLRMRAQGSTVRVRIAGDVRAPGGIVLRTPLDRPIRRATVNGRPVPVDADAREIVVRAAPADVVLEH
ncbi:discoidin domain-containing protein [Longimicrobium sp.]|uniref:discoidin domain-containing protein n=1 Tax=Longimicrobium sp. TaxID=2029185 RepID=UPI003B3ADBA5